MNDWVQALRDYKKMSGLSFIDLGRKMGLSSSTVCYAYNKSRNPTKKTRKIIINFLRKEKMLADQAENKAIEAARRILGGEVKE